MSKATNPTTKPVKAQTRLDDEAPPSDDSELDKKQHKLSSRRPTKTSQKGQAEQGQRVRYQTIVEAHTLIIRNLLRGLARDEFPSKSVVKELINGAATTAKDQGNESVALEVRRIRRIAFPSKR